MNNCAPKNTYGEKHAKNRVGNADNAIDDAPDRIRPG